MSFRHSVPIQGTKVYYENLHNTKEFKNAFTFFLINAVYKHRLLVTYLQLKCRAYRLMT